MDGVVELVNGRRGVLGIATRQHYTVVELLRDGRIGLHDRVSWTPDRQLGKGLLINHTLGDIVLEVYFQNHHVVARRMHKAMGF